MSVSFTCRLKPGTSRINPINVSRVNKARSFVMGQQKIGLAPTINLPNGQLQAVPVGKAPRMDWWPSRPRIETDFVVSFGENGHMALRKTGIDLNKVDALLIRLQELRQSPGRDNIFIMNGKMQLKGIYQEAMTHIPESDEEFVSMLVKARDGLKDEVDCEIRLHQMIEQARKATASPAEEVEMLLDVFNYVANRELSLESGDQVLSGQLVFKLSSVPGINLELLDQVLLAYYLDHSLEETGRDDYVIDSMLDGSPAFRALFKQRAEELNAADPKTAAEAAAWMDVFGFSQADLKVVL